VADKQDHVVDGTSLDVSLYTPPPCYTNKVLLTGINPSTKEETLALFLEAKTNYVIVPSSMTYHDSKEDVVLITTTTDVG